MKKILFTVVLFVALLLSACAQQTGESQKSPALSATASSQPKQLQAGKPSPVVPQSSEATSPVESGGVQTPASAEAPEDNDYDIELLFPSDKYPETALHINGAIEQGHSGICTIDRGGADNNRKKSLSGIDTRQGFDRDEWPMAMCEEGGSGASVAYVAASDNRGAGSWVGHQLSSFPDGTKVKFIVEKPANLFPNVPVAAQSATPPEPQPTQTAEIVVQTTPTPEPTTIDPGPDQNEHVVYANCDAVRAAGKAPLLRGEPGYAKKLDRDGDGIACE